ncbi:beta-propeller fold lactonase family protein [Verrucomicrobium sp. 3C]|uniref:YVTN family beta-propeller repeat protein n=1 Tax=Verrucomicrobium sp. 3C TaxID=1134055 RepID=UPI00035C1A40|nr:beta-propeller fold lactonase family protein [Verrucomicrobium sp. 3C]
MRKAGVVVPSFWLRCGSAIAVFTTIAWLVTANPGDAATAYVSVEPVGVVAINLEKMVITRRFPLRKSGPRGIGVTRDGRYVVTADKASQDVAVIDLKKRHVVRRIPIGPKPEFLKFSLDGRHFFVAHEPASEGPPPKGPQTEAEKKAQEEAAEKTPARIVEIDVASWQVVRTFPASVDTEGIELSADGKRLLCANESEDSLRVYDLETGAEVQRVNLRPYGSRPRGVKRSPDGREILVSLESSSNVVVLDQQMNFVASVPTGAGPYGISFDPDGEHFLVATSRAEKLQVFDARSRKLVKEMKVGKRCWHFTFTPDGERILAACGRSNEVLVFDAKSYRLLKVLGDIPLPWGVVSYPRAYGSLDLP